MNARAILKSCVPPLAYTVLSRLRRGRTGLATLYPTWDAAVAAGTRYDDAVILERVSTLSERTVAGVTERDGVALGATHTPFPLVAGLLRVAASNHPAGLNVIDFGGSLGSSYHQCRQMLNGIAPLAWRIVEQPHYVAQGRAEFTTPIVTFYETLEAAAAPNPPDVIILSGVLQYLDDPMDILNRAVVLQPQAIIIDRTPMTSLPQETYTIQYVPKDIFQARLPFRIFGATQIDDAVSPYHKVVSFDTVDPDMWAGNVLVKFKGALYERR